MCKYLTIAPLLGSAYTQFNCSGNIMILLFKCSIVAFNGTYQRPVSANLYPYSTVLLLTVRVMFPLQMLTYSGVSTMMQLVSTNLLVLMSECFSKGTVSTILAGSLNG